MYCTRILHAICTVGGTIAQLHSQISAECEMNRALLVGLNRTEAGPPAPTDGAEVGWLLKAVSTGELFRCVGEEFD